MNKPNLLRRFAQLFTEDAKRPKGEDTRWWVPAIRLRDTPENIGFEFGPTPKWVAGYKQPRSGRALK